MSTWEYIYLAVGTGILGVAITFAVMLICQYLGVNMLDHLWLLGVPILLSRSTVKLKRDTERLVR